MLAIHQNLDEWFLGPQGTDVLAHIDARLLELTSRLHGDTIIQLGATGKQDLLSHFSFNHRYVISPTYFDKNGYIRTSFEYLPLLKDSCHAIIAPLRLNLFDAKHWPIDELDRVLNPLGHIVVVGINPLSLWGLYARFGCLQMLGYKRRAMKSFIRLKKALEHRGYTQCHFSRFYYLPPLETNGMIQRLQFLNQMGELAASWPAAFYLLVMQKYEYCSPDEMQGVWSRGAIASIL